MAAERFHFHRTIRIAPLRRSETPHWPAVHLVRDCWNPSMQYSASLQVFRNNDIDLANQIKDVKWDCYELTVIRFGVHCGQPHMNAECACRNLHEQRRRCGALVGGLVKGGTRRSSGFLTVAPPAVIGFGKEKVGGGE